MTQLMHEINWPAVIHYDNDPELEYIKSADHWLHNEHLSIQLEPQDRLIDSLGQVFYLKPDNKGSIMLEKSNVPVSLDELLGLVKAHLADQGSCCVAKTYAPGIREAIEMIINSECPVENKR